MGRRLAAGIAIGFTALVVCLGLYAWSAVKFWPDPQSYLIFTGPPLHHLREGLFPTLEQEQEASRIYHELQDAEYAALEGALDISQWQEAIAVQFDVSNDPTASFTHRHRLIWDIFSPFYNCPSQQRVGTPLRLFDGGKWLCGVQPLLQKPGCVVYSFGSNGQVTFEEAVVEVTQHHCEVHVFDFTLSSQQRQQVEAIKGVFFHDYGIGTTDATVQGRFQYENRVVTSYSLKTLPTIMLELGHAWVHVFKMDVEGAEYEVLPSIMTHYAEAKQVVPITQAQIEYHHWAGRPSSEDMLSTLRLVEESGFRAFHSEYNYHGEAWNFIEYAYLHVDSEGHVVSPTEVGPYHAVSNRRRHPKQD